MQKYTEAVAAWLVKCQVIEEQEKELYCYAMESYILFWSPVIIALLSGIIMGRVKESIFVIIPFMIIRKYSGGYHTKHLSVCLICSLLLLLLCILIACSIPANTILMFITLIACLNLIIFSPIDHENRILGSKEKIVYKKVIGIFTSVAYMTVWILRSIGFERETVCICVGILLTAGLQVPCILKRIIKRMTK